MLGAVSVTSETSLNGGDGDTSGIAEREVLSLVDTPQMSGEFQTTLFTKTMLYWMDFTILGASLAGNGLEGWCKDSKVPNATVALHQVHLAVNGLQFTSNVGEIRSVSGLMLQARLDELRDPHGYLRIALHLRRVDRLWDLHGGAAVARLPREIVVEQLEHHDADGEDVAGGGGLLGGDLLRGHVQQRSRNVLHFCLVCRQAEICYVRS